MKEFMLNMMRAQTRKSKIVNWLRSNGYTIAQETPNGARIRISDNRLVSIVFAFDCPDVIETMIYLNENDADHDSVDRHDSYNAEDYTLLRNYLKSIM